MKFENHTAQILNPTKEDVRLWGAHWNVCNLTLIGIWRCFDPIIIEDTESITNLVSESAQPGKEAQREEEVAAAQMYKTPVLNSFP